MDDMLSIWMDGLDKASKVPSEHVH
jgi:hypothetical protein